MQRHFAALVAIVVLFAAFVVAPTVAVAGPLLADAGAADAGAADAGPTVDAGGTPDAVVGPDSAFFPPALDDGEKCNCASTGGSSGAGTALLALGVVFVFRRRR